MGSVASYIYDADGNRYSASNLGTTTNYTVDTSLPYASVVEEYSNGTLAAQYDYGDDLVRMDRGSGVYYYIYDGLGSTRQLVNPTGAVTDTWGYSAFGELASHTGSTVNPFLFNAQQFDQASGDYFLRARYYDQTSGRFISQDPFGGNSEDPVTLHRYLYANVDPINVVDPSGNEGELVETLVASTEDIGISARTSSTAIRLLVAGIRFAAQTAVQSLITDIISQETGLNPTVVGLALGAGGLVRGAGAASLRALVTAWTEREASGSIPTLAQATAAFGKDTYGSFKSFLNNLFSEGGNPLLDGEAIEWHHLVPLLAGRVGRFSQRAINSVLNVLPTPRSQHAIISALYNSKPAWLVNQGFNVTLGEYVARELSWEEAWDFGFKVWKEVRSAGPAITRGEFARGDIVARPVFK